MCPVTCLSYFTNRTTVNQVLFCEVLIFANICKSRQKKYKEILSISDTHVAKKFFQVQNARSQNHILAKVSKGFPFAKIDCCK